MERPWPRSWADAGRRRTVAAVAAAMTLGVVSERAQFGLDDPARWVPDLAAGTALVISGAIVVRRQRTTGALLAAAGGSWFLANLWPAALLWHRGPLFHAVSIGRGSGRLRRAVDGAFLALAYGGAVVPAPGRSEGWNLAAGAGLVAMAGLNARDVPAGNRRAPALAAAGAALGAAVMAAAVIRSTADGHGRLWLLATHLFEAGIVAAAGLLAWGSRPPRVGEIADLVVHLDDARSPSVRDALARVLGDPTLEIGFADDRGGFHDGQGRPVLPGSAPAGRVATVLGDPTTPFAVLVHDPAALRDEAVVEAVAAVARLARTHEMLDRAVQSQLDDVAASRHRLVAAADDELRRLERQVHQGPEPRLRQVEEALAAIVAAEGGYRAGGPLAHVDQARDHTRAALGDLHEIARGLHPVGLARGLTAALTELATRAPVEVHLVADERRTAPDDVAAAAYFVCAEAISNVAKHSSAGAASVKLEVADAGLTITVADDGTGGADPALGSGLRGIIDRVEAMGGRVAIDSAPSAGTRLVAELPLGDQPFDEVPG